MKGLARDTVWSTAGLLGLTRLARRLSQHRVRILMYHAVVADDAPFSRWTHLPLSRFRWQVQHLAQNYDVRSLSEIVTAIRDGQPLPTNAAVITFDDGYGSVHQRAFPELQRHGLPASVFLTTEFVDKQQLMWTSRLFLALRATPRQRLSLPTLGFADLRLGTEAERDRVDEQLRRRLKGMTDADRVSALRLIEDELQVQTYLDYAREFAPMTWAQVRAMQATGLFEFGAHSVTHPILSRLPQAQLQHEVLDSCDTIRHELGQPHVCFAYPNGQADDFNEATKMLLRHAGAPCALSTIEGLWRPGDDLLALPRIGIGNDMSNSRFAAVCSGLESGCKRRLGRL